jgi:FKBP-type peptidyl-prolyl cis-trans isomerase FkpA
MAITKQKVITTVALALAVLGLVFGYIFYWQKQHSSKDVNATTSQGSSAAANPGLIEPKSIPLGGNSSAATDSNGVKVTNNAPADPANLGSGTKKSSAAAGLGGVPGPDTFGQYEQYKDAKNALFSDLKVGTGPEVVANKRVAIFYKAYFTNGKIFDQTAEKPYIFSLGIHQVIAGIEQAIVGMKVGGSRRMVIPPVAGYGAQGQGPVPPNAVLVFDVQLAEVEK